MDTCDHVPQRFLDPRTGITDSCRSVCNIRNPVESPVDCMERCPELFQCLVSLLNHDVTSPMTSSIPTTNKMPTPPDDSEHALHIEDHVIYISTITLLLVVVMILCTMIYTLKVKIRKLTRVNRGHSGVDHLERMPDSPVARHLLDGTNQNEAKSHNFHVTSDLHSVRSSVPSSDLPIGGLVRDLQSKPDSSLSLRSNVYGNDASVHSCLRGDSMNNLNVKTEPYNIHTDSGNQTVTPRDSLIGYLRPETGY